MSYTPSSLEDFEAGVAEVEVLLRLKIVAARTQSAEELAEESNAIHRAAVILLTSHFESYLKGLAEDFIEHFGDGNWTAKQIPVGVRELHTLPKLQEVVASSNPTQRAALLKKMPSVTQLWNDSAKPSKGTLNPDVLSAVVTSAKADKIDRLFELMGSRSGVCDGDVDYDLPKGETHTLSIRLGLEDVVSCRNSIAHGDADRKPTGADVDKYIAFLSSLARRFQRRATALLKDNPGLKVAVDVS